MSISYVLHENNLTSDPNDYTAMVIYAGTVGLEGVIERMIEQGSTITKADALAVLQDYHAAIENLTLSGFKVTTPGANYGASIKGVFNGQTDSYDPSRHSLEPAVSSGAQFRRKVRENAQPQKQEAVKPHPSLLEYTDLNSGERNSVLTAGGMGQLAGHRLKFDPAAPNQGIFFRAAASGNAARVEIVGKNKPGELMFLVPASLTSGDYTVEVRAAFGQNDIRTGALGAVLSVA